MSLLIGIKWDKWPERTLSGRTYSRSEIQIIGLDATHFCVEHLGVPTKPINELVNELLPTEQPAESEDVNDDDTLEDT